MSEKTMFKSNPTARLIVETILFIFVVWIMLVLFFNLGGNGASFVFIVPDADSLRTLLGSIFQGLASFFAIVISVSLLVSQLAYGSFSPRLMPNFLKNKSFLVTMFLFLGALSLNLFLLSFLSINTLNYLIGPIFLDLIVSFLALLSVVPLSSVLLNLAHPLNIGLELVDKFNNEYFQEIRSYSNGSQNDILLPLLQSILVKSIRDADTDFAQRLLGSFSEKVLARLDDNTAILFANYFDSFFKKISIVASEEKEGDLLKQLISINESFELKVSKSHRYLSDSYSRYDGSFARNIIFIIDLCVRENHDQVLGMSLGAMARLRKILIHSIPPDDEIDIFRTIKYFKEGGKELGEAKDSYFLNENVFNYIKNTFFESIFSLASAAIQKRNLEAAHRLVSEIFYTRHDLEKLNQAQYKEATSNISFSNFWNLERLGQQFLRNNSNPTREIAVGVQEASDFFFTVDPRLGEGYVDLLGSLLIETTERKIFDSDPFAPFFWAGVAMRRLLRYTPIEIPMKLLAYFEKVLVIIQKHQVESSNPILQKIKETICREIASIKNGEIKDTYEPILTKADEILAKYPEVNLGE